MSAVAKILQDSGWEVTGSDEGVYPPISEVIARYGIPIQEGYRAENIPDGVDRIVIGMNAKLVPETNPEVAAAYASGKRASFPDILQELTQVTENIVVAGSFGKSSCSALTTWALKHAGRDPSWFVGAEAKDLADNGHRGEGAYFVLEGDEYPACHWNKQSKFLQYNISHLLLTSGTHDHVNIFPTLHDYLKPFAKLVAQVPSAGKLVACATGEHLPALLAVRDEVVWYALEAQKGVRWWAGNVVPSGSRTTFTLVQDGRSVIDLSLGLLGVHNVENAVGVAALLLEIGALTPEEIAAAFAAFHGVRRRLERLTPEEALPLYNDFGSSFPKCRAGLEAIRAAYPDRRITVVFEPHTFSFRNRAAQHWYDTLFQGADRVLVLPPPTQGQATHDQVSHEEIVERIRQSGVETVDIADAAHLLQEAARGSDPAHDLVLIESSGGILGALEALTAWASGQH
jgi:UDP-N-acetylmuramate: L-alanyl-gamma-D-glutamyl-meso-diaminopimelate ligase